MAHKYSVEKNVQILLSLMKAHGITKVIASPGSTNVCLVHSLQNDSDFTVFSAVDERSAAYMACGMAAETGEPVALTCTEATASRNYMPALTEAFYRKLPILAITATNEITLVGQHHPQMIDRSVTPKDLVLKNLFVPILTSPIKEKGYTNLINDAMLELKRNGGGPVHIEYETRYCGDYTVEELPKVNVTKRISAFDKMPELKPGKIALFVGSHPRWSDKLTHVVDEFCRKYDAIVLRDHINNYQGEFGVDYTILSSQLGVQFDCACFDTVIYMGSISSAYKKMFRMNNIWRVSPDGELRNMLHQYGGKLQYVFEMPEEEFFVRYANMKADSGTGDFISEWRSLLDTLHNEIGELPFSNLWVAQHTAPKLPKNSRLFLAIENTLRSWNYFVTDKSIEGYCNTGGFGIDGGVSSMVGASIVNPEKLFFMITGDLAFFYDMNCLGNRHIGKNIRLLVINNGVGQQFRNPGYYAIRYLGEAVDDYVAAAGHFGNKSPQLLKHYAEDLGFEYLSASTKEDFLDKVDTFCNPEIGNKSILFEIFTDTHGESAALEQITGLRESIKSKLKNYAFEILGAEGLSLVKKLIGHKLK